MVSIFKASGTITGLYREDYGYNPTSNAFAVYCDIWRQAQGQLTSLGGNTDGSYAERINGNKKGVS